MFWRGYWGIHVYWSSLYPTNPLHKPVLSAANLVWTFRAICVRESAWYICTEQLFKHLTRVKHCWIRFVRRNSCSNVKELSDLIARVCDVFQLFLTVVCHGSTWVYFLTSFISKSRHKRVWNGCNFPKKRLKNYQVVTVTVLVPVLVPLSNSDCDSTGTSKSEGVSLLFLISWK